MNKATDYGDLKQMAYFDKSGGSKVRGAIDTIKDRTDQRSVFTQFKEFFTRKLPATLSSVKTKVYDLFAMGMLSGTLNKLHITTPLVSMHAGFLDGQLNELGLFDKADLFVKYSGDVTETSSKSVAFSAGASAAVALKGEGDGTYTGFNASAGGTVSKTFGVKKDEIKLLTQMQEAERRFTETLPNHELTRLLNDLEKGGGKSVADRAVEAFNRELKLLADACSELTEASGANRSVIGKNQAKTFFATMREMRTRQLLIKASLERMDKLGLGERIECTLGAGGRNCMAALDMAWFNRFGREETVEFLGAMDRFFERPGDFLNLSSVVKSEYERPQIKLHSKTEGVSSTVYDAKLTLKLNLFERNGDGVLDVASNGLVKQFLPTNQAVDIAYRKVVKTPKPGQELGRLEDKETSVYSFTVAADNLIADVVTSLVMRDDPDGKKPRVDEMVAQGVKKGTTDIVVAYGKKLAPAILDYFGFGGGDGEKKSSELKLSSHVDETDNRSKERTWSVEMDTSSKSRRVKCIRKLEKRTATALTDKLIGVAASKVKIAGVVSFDYSSTRTVTTLEGAYYPSASMRTMLQVFGELKADPNQWKAFLVKHRKEVDRLAMIVSHLSQPADEVYPEEDGDFLIEDHEELRKLVGALDPEARKKFDAAAKAFAEPGAGNRARREAFTEIVRILSAS